MVFFEKNEVGWRQVLWTAQMNPKGTHLSVKNDCIDGLRLLSSVLCDNLDGRNVSMQTKGSRGERDRRYGHDEANGPNVLNGDQVMTRSKSQGGALTGS